MEDDPAQAFDLADLLMLEGHDVITVQDGASANEELEGGRFDLLIADLIIRREGQAIPDGGILLIGRLRMAGKLPELAWIDEMPILAVSGSVHNKGMGHALSLANDLGADAILSKPFSSENLLEAVNLLLTEGRQLKRRES